MPMAAGFPDDDVVGVDPDDDVPGVVAMPVAGRRPRSGGRTAASYGFHEIGDGPGVDDGPDPRWPDPPTGLSGSGSRAGATALLAAFNPGRRAVRALAVVAALVVVIAAFVAWHSEPHPEAAPAPVTTQTPPATAAIPPAAGTAGAGVPSISPSSAGSTGPMIVVAVTGRVRHPGLVTIPAGSRVADAIAAAGGALPNTDLSFINLARKVSDGELIVIDVAPSPGMTVDPTGNPATSTGGEPGSTTLVNINTADLTQLETLPGVGPALGQRIIDYRTQHGRFRNVDALQDVSGIGPTIFAQLKDLVTT